MPGRWVDIVGSSLESDASSLQCLARQGMCNALFAVMGGIGWGSDASLITTPDTNQGSDVSFIPTLNKNKDSNALLSQYQKWAGGVMHHLLWQEVWAGSINASLFTTPYMGSGLGSHASQCQAGQKNYTSNVWINATLWRGVMHNVSRLSADQVNVMHHSWQWWSQKRKGDASQDGYKGVVTG